MRVERRLSSFCADGVLRLGLEGFDPYGPGWAEYSQRAERAWVVWNTTRPTGGEYMEVRTLEEIAEWRWYGARSWRPMDASNLPAQLRHWPTPSVAEEGRPLVIQPPSWARYYAWVELEC